MATSPLRLQAGRRLFKARIRQTPLRYHILRIHRSHRHIPLLHRINITRRSPRRVIPDPPHTRTSMLRSLPKSRIRPNRTVPEQTFSTLSPHKARSTNNYLEATGTKRIRERTKSRQDMEKTSQTRSRLHPNVSVSRSTQASLADSMLLALPAAWLHRRVVYLSVDLRVQEACLLPAHFSNHTVEPTSKCRHCQ